ncbi:MAG: 1-deoxy-D-xylulose-5-phosphate synthase [Faecalibacterium sp.]
MKYTILEQLEQPGDLKALTEEQVRQLCEEIRQFLLENISKTGGHLASNLGVVELTVALHRVLQSPRDKIVFDVGHQCYTHKILTGRRKDFAKLRQLDGISGFPNPKESEHDAFIAGHGNTALSLAIGMAWAKKLRGEPGMVVALIGDGAFTGGMVYEGMNNIGSLDNLMVILNDNEMSISKNVGTLAHYLTHLRTTTAYFKAKGNVRGFLDSVPLIGPPLCTALEKGKTMLRRALYDSTIFEDMGFRYIGPVDGHNEPELEWTLKNISSRSGPYLVHVITTKGKGYHPAEVNPGNYHGVSSFDPADAEVPDPEVAPKESFSNVFGKTLSAEADQNASICAITAAMKYGTGLQFFCRDHRQRFFDVGMAEQHAVTFAAGLASQGMLPVVAVYSTFLQRSYDQIIHDVNLLKEGVVFAIDRAGFVPGDGETHQGIYDPAFLSQLGIPVYSPTNYAELKYWLHVLLDPAQSGPRAIRYPRGGESPRLAQFGCTGREYDRIFAVPDAKAVIVSYADETEDALWAAELLAGEKLPCDVYKVVKVFPFTEGFVQEITRYPVVLMAEECIARGSVGEHLDIALREHGWRGCFLHRAVRETCLPHATVPQIKHAMGMDAAQLAQAIREVLCPQGQKGETAL